MVRSTKDLNAQSLLGLFNAQILEALPPYPLFHTGKAGRPNDLQIPYETSSRTRWSASPQHRPADKTSGPACSPTDTACCRYLSSRRRRNEIAAKFSSASRCP